MNRIKILVVDDETSIVKFLQANLRDHGYEVFTAMDGVEALHVTEKVLPDLVILDITMPKMDGFEACRRIREWSQAAIIMVSARADELDKVRSFDLGADDYVTKPFGAGELIARVKAVLRRTRQTISAPNQPVFKAGELEINYAQRRVTVAGTEVKLTNTEFNLLQELSVNAGKVLTYSHLLNRVWGQGYHDEKEYLYVYTGRLRHRIEVIPGQPKHIITVPGVGYKFAVDNAP